MNTPRRPRTCEVCSQQYIPTYHKQRTCGRICGAQIKAAARVSRKPPPVSLVRWRQCSSGAHWYTTVGCKRCPCGQYQSVAGAIEMRTCTSCGSDYQHRRKQGAVRPLCPSCNEVAADEARRQHRRNGRRRRRARLHAIASDGVPDRDIYERDKWKCGICCKRINRDAVVPHPKAPTIDHVIPISQGGDDTAANRRAACFMCNSLRGAGGGNEQLALLG